MMFSKTTAAPHQKWRGAAALWGETGQKVFANGAKQAEKRGPFVNSAKEMEESL
ncbi:hypothetical protein [Faecalibacterium duncaniae]